MALLLVGGALLWWGGGDGDSVRVDPIGEDRSSAVRVIGIDVPGWTLVDTERPGERCCAETFGAGRAVFTSTADSIDPHIEVGVLRAGGDMIADDSIDLGPGVEEANYAGDQIFWTQDDRTTAYVEGYGVTREELEAYARELAATHVDPATVTAPAGLAEVRRGSRSFAGDAVTTTRYEVDGGSVTVEVSDEVGWLEDRLQGFPDAVPVDVGVRVGGSALGGGPALLVESADPAAIIPGSGQPPFQRAFWRTANGMSVHLSAEGGGAEGILRQLLEEGRLVVLDS